MSSPVPPVSPKQCGLSDPPLWWHPSACLSVFHVFEVSAGSVCVPRRPSPLLLRLQRVDSAESCKVRAFHCQPTRYPL